jgi:two-component system, NarL family, sensor histidine kinase UhpB
MGKRTSKSDAAGASLAASSGSFPQRSSDNAGSIAVLIGAILLVAAIASTHWTTAQALEVSAQVARTHAVLASLQEILEGLGSARYNATLFVMSSDDTFLQHYERGVSKAQAAMARARELTGHNPAQQERLERVQADTDVIVKWLGKVADARKSEGAQGATQRIFGGQGLHRFADMRDTIRNAMEEEERLLADREARLATRLRNVEYARIAGMAAAVILLVGAFGMLRRRNRLLEHARQALQASNATLELRVGERTRELNAAASRLAEELAERERRERVIQENEELLRTIIENSIDPIFVKDRRGRYLMANVATASALGRPREDILGADDRALFPGDQAEAIMAHDRSIMETRKAVTLEHELPMAAGVRTYLTTKAPLYDRNGQTRGLFGVARDVTEFKQNEARLRETAQRLEALSAALIDIQEKERHALSRELHDEVGQQLAALKINLDRLAEQTSGTGALERLSDSQQLVEQVIGRIRATALDLRPHMLDDLGLAPALHWYAHQQQERSGCVIAVRAAEVPLPADRATACYRIVQEAVNNALRHGGSTRIHVRLEIHETEIDLLVADDGRGFDRDLRLSKPTPGMGLVDMQERAALLGGSLVIESAPGCGTTLRARIPLAQAKA